MKKIIMYLEDNAYLKNHTLEMLNKKLSDDMLSADYEVKAFYRFDQANDFIDEPVSEDNSPAEICCIITDLNMGDQWLEDHQGETNGGMFSGWVWLKYYVFNVLLDIPIIIYSGYTAALDAYLEEKKEIKNRRIQSIPKGGSDREGFNALYNCLKNIL